MLRRFWIVVGLFLPALAIAPALTVAEQPANEHFQRTWERTDKPVADGAVSRTWMWGPQAFTAALTEPYAESPGGVRQVQYFDKSRMEISDPGGDPDSIWYVTNGLLSIELITGRMQLGDSEFVERGPAAINVAGDATDPNGPTYASFAQVLDQTPHTVGQVVIQRIDRAGTLMDDPALADQNVLIALVDDVTNHGIATPFWDFMNATGPIYENGELATGALFSNPYFATGRPITEPAWARVRVDGVEKDVLIQCFERRCLTFTPSNSAEWRVEAANVGRHYHDWRYASPLEGHIAYGRNAIYILDVSTGETDSFVLLEPEPPDGEPGPTYDDQYSSPSWSPDGTQLLLEYWYTFGSSPIDIFIVDADGSNLRQLTSFGERDGTQAISPAWSPDGEWIAFRAPDGDIYLIRPDGTEQHPLGIALPDWQSSPAWSPDSTRLAFLNGDIQGEGDVDKSIWVVDVAGGEPQQLVDCDDFFCDDLDWSPDGSSLLYRDGRTFYVLGIASRQRSALITFDENPGTYPTWSPNGNFIAYSRSSLGAIWVMNADGTDNRPLVAAGVTGRSIDWGP